MLLICRYKVFLCLGFFVFVFLCFSTVYLLTIMKTIHTTKCREIRCLFMENKVVISHYDRNHQLLFCEELLSLLSTCYTTMMHAQRHSLVTLTYTERHLVSQCSGYSRIAYLSAGVINALQSTDHHQILLQAGVNHSLMYQGVSAAGQVYCSCYLSMLPALAAGGHAAHLCPAAARGDHAVCLRFIAMAH